MGAACCIAARDRTLQQGSSHDMYLHRSTRDSPSWSFRWDNRGRVAGEDASPSWLSDRYSRSGTLDSKSLADVSAHSSNTGVMMKNDRTGAWCNSVMEDPISVSTRPSASGRSQATNISLEVGFSESPQPSDRSITKQSPATQSLPSLSTTPTSLSDRHQVPPLPITSTPQLPRWAHQYLSQQSLSFSGVNSPTFIDERNNPSDGSPITMSDSTRRSEGRCSDNWSVHTFSEFMSASLPSQHHHLYPYSFDSETDLRPNGRRSISSSSSVPSIKLLQTTCGVCSKLLSEKSAWTSQRFTTGSIDLPVVAVLMCGHVYHADCLEHVTLETDKYDPGCPLCTFDEKKLTKLAGKLVKGGEKELIRGKYGRERKSRNRVMDGDEVEMDEVDLSRSRSCDQAREGKGGPKFRLSPSLKVGSIGKPSVRRQFSFGSKDSRLCSDSSSNPRWKKGLFWARSSSRAKE